MPDAAGVNVHAPRTLLRLSRRMPTAHVPGVDRFAGGALLSLALESGDVLSIRRCAASSLGPPFTQVWHRSAARDWTAYSDVARDRTSARYYAPQLCDVRSDDIDFVWKSRRDLVVYVRRARLQLVLRLEATAATRAVNAVTWLLPRRAQYPDGVLRLLGHAAGAAFGTGSLVLAGRAPSGHRFRMRPRAIWAVAGAAAVIGGRDLGGHIELTERVALGDLVLPRRPLFMLGAESYG